MEEKVKLQNLNDLKRNSHKGIFKRWLYKEPSDYSLVCDYLQKMNNSIDDINEELELGNLKCLKISFILLHLLIG